MTSVNNWISVHVFIGINPGNFSSTVMNVVKPLIEMVKLRIQIKRFFYIYYLERGPHLRIRIQPINNSDLELVENLVSDFFKEYFINTRRKRDDSDLQKHQLVLQENDSITFEPYQRELGRYLGERGLDICEDHFYLSTLTMFEIFNHYNLVDEAKRIQLSIQCQVSLLAIFNISFMSKYFSDTFAAYFDYYYVKLIVVTEREKVMEQFDSFYLKNQEAIKKQILLIRDAVRNDRKFEEKWFNEWIKGNFEIRKNLDAVLSENVAQNMESSPRLQSLSAIDPKEAPLMYLCDSLIHMHSNRLGLSNTTETLILYCLKKASSELNL
jgi:thiopeptide-type bacteriocin biosynthesis protein